VQPYSKYFIILFCAFLATKLPAQNNRLNDDNTIGWVTNNTTFQLSKKVGIHAEYQWRRADGVTNWQQALYRTGINYQLNSKILFRVGYAYIDTYNYGDYPIQAAGKTFPENRLFQMATITDKVGKIDISHRFMLEQRWVGRFTNPTLEKADDNVFQNRVRYMYRMQMPLKGKAIGNKTPYVAMYDELFIGFGKNVNANVFDQNRFAALVGYRFNNTLRIEGGFFNQIVQLGRTINTQNVFQYNSGFIINTFVNLNLQKK